MEEHIITLLKNNLRVIIPEFGAFIIRQKDPEIIVFNEFLRYNDGLLIDHVAKTEQLDKEIATQKVSYFAEESTKSLESGTKLEIKGLGSLSRDASGKIHFIEEKAGSQKARQTVKAQSAGKKRVQEPGETKAAESSGKAGAKPKEKQDAKAASETIPKKDKPAGKTKPVEEAAKAQEEEGTKEQKEDLSPAPKEEEAHKEKAASQAKKEEVISTGKVAEPAKKEEKTSTGKTAEPAKKEEKTSAGETAEPAKKEEKTSTVKAAEPAKKEEKTSVGQTAEPAKKEERPRVRSAPEMERKTAGTTGTERFPAPAHRKSNTVNQILIWIGIFLIANITVLAWFLYRDQIRGFFGREKGTEVLFDSVAVEEETQPIFEPAEEDTTPVFEEVPVQETPTVQEAPAVQEVSASPAAVASQPRYYIVAGCFREESNADALVQSLRNRGFDAEKFGEIGNLHAVSYSSYSNQADALKELERIRQEEQPEAWMTRF